MRQAAFALMIFLIMVSQSAYNDARADQAEDEEVIRNSVASYTEAFNNQDAKTLAEHWSPDAVYTNPVTGETAVGREEIEQHFADNFANDKEAKLETVVDSIRFLSPNVAIENGVARVKVGEDQPIESSYSAVHIKRDGKWLVDRVTEEDIAEVVSNYEKLKDLEWMIGTWVDEDEQSKVQATCQWSKNRNFIVRSFSITVGDRLDKSGIQLIGWDPIAKQIRSWVFDSDGGIGQGVWTNKDNKWFVQAKDTTADGQELISQNVLTVIDDDRFTWQSVDRQLKGELLPNIDEVVVVRAADGE